jgi:NADPH-dependent 2,4-dienoyl-CoA reductase/sulfur reductase-like enzyme
MGCRERTRAQVNLPGTRPAGVYTAGTAQRLVNIDGFMPGKRFVILGSGDIGMIMARRLIYEGASVERVLEIMPYLSGLTRNCSMPSGF